MLKNGVSPNVELGFSLISIVMSISIFTILVTLTLTNLSFLDQLLVKIELSSLYATCCYAQQVAQLRQQPCEIIFDLSTNTYTCQNFVRTLPHAVIFGAQENLYGPPSIATKPIVQPITFKNACIQATADGILNAGTVYLIDRNKRYQYALSSAVTQISCLRCYCHTDGWKLLR